MSERFEFALLEISICLAAAALAIAVDRLGLFPASPMWLVFSAFALPATARRVYAIRTLRWNYTWRGVFVWLKGRKRSTGRRGLVMVLRDPARVAIEQRAIAEGVMG